MIQSSVSRPPTLDWINVLQAGARGNGTTDDSGAINAALATGRPVYLPRASSYRLSSPLQFSSQAGQRIIGDGPVMSILNADAGVSAIRLGARSQQVENLTINGPGKATTGNGIDILAYYPFWKALNVLISGMAIGVNNKVFNPGMGDPGGSDAGGIFGSQFTTCGTGYLAYGNKDDTPVMATSIGSCDVGIQVDGDGGCSYGDGGVLGGNTTAFLVSSGNGSIKNAHIEGTPTSGISLDVAANSNLTIIDCAAQNGGDTSIIDIRCASGATAYCYGQLSGFANGRVNGTGQIINQSRVVLAVDYNGASGYAYNAGDFTVVDTSLPSATALTVGTRVMLLIPNSRDIYLGTQTGASTYAWRLLAPSLAQIIAQAGITPTANSTTTPVTSITSDTGIITAKS